MGRFNWMLRVIRKTSAVGVVGVALSATTPNVAVSFGVNDDVDTSELVGTCYLDRLVRNSGNPVAYMYLWDPAGVNEAEAYVRDRKWEGNTVIRAGYTNGSNEALGTALERCWGNISLYGPVTNVQQYGFVTDTYVADPYMGFAYTMDGVSYDYSIGTIPKPDAPTNLVTMSGDGLLSIVFTAPIEKSPAAITDYEYELDGSGTWTSSGKTSSPVVITALTNGTRYSIKLRAVNSQGGGVQASASGLPADTSAPNVELSGPTDIVTDAFTVTATFSENVVGFDLSDITVVNGTASDLNNTAAPVYTFKVTPDLGTTVSVSIGAGVADDAAGNANTASSTLSVQAGSPESYFAEQEAEVQAIITQDATRSLNSTLSSNQRMTRGARSRFIESRNQGEGDGAGLATRNNVPFDVDGTFDLDGSRLSSKGTFFGQTGDVEGTERRLVFGEFDVQRDGDTGSTTATLTGRVAWEQMISDDTMLGYFVGGELADSNISGAFEGKQTRVAATAGGYAVRALSETLFADGFISIGAGRNNLEMADDVLALTSDYTTRTATVGGALTGVYAYERYELRPEMAFSYGKTWIGNVGFAGVAYGLTDDALSLDAGNVSIASLTLRPEIVWALDAETVAGSNAQLSFAPRFICERTTTATTTQNCGTGAEIGLSGNSEDGLSSANIRFVMDRVGNSNRSNVVFNVEQRF